MDSSSGGNGFALISPFERVCHRAVVISIDATSFRQRSSVETKLPRLIALRTKLLSQISTGFIQEACWGCDDVLARRDLRRVRSLCLGYIFHEKQQILVL
jgi:hypothetical protein